MENSNSSNGKAGGIGIIAKYVEMIGQEKKGDGRGGRGWEETGEAAKTACARCAAGVWTIEIKRRDRSKVFLHCFCDVMKTQTWADSAEATNELFVLDCSFMVPVDDGVSLAQLVPSVPSVPVGRGNSVGVQGMPEFQ